MLQADIEYRNKGLLGNDYDCIVTGPNGTKTFYGKESRDEAWNYYQLEKRLEDEILLRQKQSDLADMQMHEIKERERRAQEEKFHQKNTPLQFDLGRIPPHTIFQKTPIPPLYNDPEYIEFQKWKKENDPEYVKFKKDKARKAAEEILWRMEEEARKQKEQKQETIAEAKELLKKAKKQTQNKTLAKAQDKIAEIELLIRKGTQSDFFKVIEILIKQYDWQLNEKETFNACLSNFDNEKESFVANRQKNILQAREELAAAKKYITKDKIGQTKSIIANIETLIKKETNVDAEEANKLLKKVRTWKIQSGKNFSARLSDFDAKYIQCEESEGQEKKRKQEADRLFEQRRQETERKKREAEERIRKQKEADTAKKFFWTIFVIALIIGVIFLIATYWQVILVVLVLGGIFAAASN